MYLEESIIVYSCKPWDPKGISNGTGKTTTWSLSSIIQGASSKGSSSQVHLGPENDWQRIVQRLSMSPRPMVWCRSPFSILVPLWEPLLKHPRLMEKCHDRLHYWTETSCRTCLNWARYQFEFASFFDSSWDFTMVGNLGTPYGRPFWSEFIELGMILGQDLSELHRTWRFKKKRAKIGVQNGRKNPQKGHKFPQTAANPKRGTFRNMFEEFLFPCTPRKIKMIDGKSNHYRRILLKMGIFWVFCGIAY